ncbi:MAG: Disulfide bond reductase DsbH [Chlamydiae bacterium]|nr:Disulfide bond reductase DsbH [Chlamydiota bacterium]
MKVIIACILLICNSGYAKWHDNYKEAKKIATLEEKPLLIVFLGPNWCPWSDQLEVEVLASNAFLENLEKEVVLLKVDIPEDFDEEGFPGQDLRNQFHVEECPSLVLVESSGEEIAKLSYLPIDQKEFVTYIKETLSDHRKISRITKQQLDKLKVEELKSLYAKAGRLADVTFKKALLDQGLKSDRSPFFLLEQYSNLFTSRKMSSWKLRSIRKKIIARDPENKEGYQRKLAVMDFEALASVKKPQKAEIVVGPLVEYMQNFGKKDQKNAWHIEMKISQYFFTQNQIEDALRHAKASLDAAPKQHKKDIAESIEYLQKYVQ